MPQDYHYYYEAASLPQPASIPVDRTSCIPFKVGDIVYDAFQPMNYSKTTRLKVLAVHSDSFDYEIVNYSDKSFIGRKGTLPYAHGSWKLWQKTGLAKFVELQAALSGDCQGQENLTI